MPVNFGVEMSSAGRLLRVFQRLREAGRGRQLYRDVADYIVDAVRSRFESKRSPEGLPWKEWSDGYAATRTAGDSLLVHTHDLERGIQARFFGDVVSIGVEDAPYAAAVHKTRPFMGISASEAGEVMAMIESSFLEAIDAA